jgi:delta-aminolevulinic acid dehydratase/porphobilinogen synthase
MRAMVRENIITPKDFILPLFIDFTQAAGATEEITSMPGCFR